MRPFVGAKLLLYLGDRLVILRRDHAPGLHWPGMMDFPGGGREGAETPADCVIRETREEIGLEVLPSDLKLAHLRQVGSRRGWYFAAHLEAAREAKINFGGEGAGWEMMSPSAYLVHPLAIPHFAEVLRGYEKRRTE